MCSRSKTAQTKSCKKKEAGWCSKYPRIQEVIQVSLDRFEDGFGGSILLSAYEVVKQFVIDVFTVVLIVGAVSFFLLFTAGVTYVSAVFARMFYVFYIYKYFEDFHQFLDDLWAFYQLLRST